MGDVVIDHGPLIGDAVINDGPGIMLVVQKYRGANTLEVTRGVEEAMDELQPGLPGITVDTTIFRPATFIEQSIDNLTTAMLIGILLVILIIIAFLFEWRTAFISLIAIPLSLVSAIVILDLCGATINVMVLAGLVVAIGVVVDDAIIDVENIVRRVRQARAEGSDKSMFAIMLDASVEVRSAIIYATVINVVAIVPVFFLEGLSGSFFRPLVLSYGLAVLVSMVVALTLTPALCLLMLSRGKLISRESPLLRVLKRGYRAALAPLLRRPGPTFGAVLALAIVGAIIFPTLGTQLLPNFKERDFLMHWLTQPGTSQPEETRVVRRRLQGPAGDSRRAQLRLAHRSGLPRRRGLRRRLRRELDQRVTRSRLRRHPGGGAEDGRFLPRRVPRRPDLSARANQGGAHRVERGDRRAHLRSRSRRCCARRPTRSRRLSPVWTVSWTRTRHSRRACRTSWSSRTWRPRGRWG